MHLKDDIITPIRIYIHKFRAQNDIPDECKKKMGRVAHQNVYKIYSLLHNKSDPSMKRIISNSFLYIKKKKRKTPLCIQ